MKLVKHSKKLAQCRLRQAILVDLWAASRSGSVNQSGEIRSEKPGRQEGAPTAPGKEVIEGHDWAVEAGRALVARLAPKDDNKLELSLDSTLQDPYHSA